MRRHLGPIASLVAAAALLLGATSASAYTLTISPGGTTAGTAGRSEIAFNTTRRTINCTTSGYGATYLSGSYSMSLAFPFSDSTNAQLTFSSCTFAGGVPVTIACTRTTSLNALPIPTTLGVTRISITAIACTATLPGPSACRVNIGGGVFGSHDNTLGQITVSPSSQSLAATGAGSSSGPPCTALPNDPSLTLTTSTGFGPTYTESPAQTLTVA